MEDCVLLHCPICKSMAKIAKSILKTFITNSSCKWEEHIKFKGFDHLVFTVTDVVAMVCFYTQVLEMSVVVEGSRHELHFGTQKINLHSRPGEFPSAAENPFTRQPISV